MINTYRHYLKYKNRAVRIINSSSYLAHTSPIFEKIAILKIYKIYKLKVAILMFKIEKHIVPSDISEMFVKNSAAHRLHTLPDRVIICMYRL